MRNALLGLALAVAPLTVAAADPRPTPSESIFAGTMVDMSWQQVEAAAKRGAIVIFPVAVVEEHGPHLDLSPDVYLTAFGARETLWHLRQQGIEAVIAPPYYWGINASTGTFPGSFSLKPETMKAVLRESCANLAQWGFRAVFLLNLHGDPAHSRTVKELADEYGPSAPLRVYDVASLPAGDAVFRPPAARTSLFRPDYHAGANESKAMLDLHPARVDRMTAASLKPQGSFAPLGYVGDPANMENGAGREWLDEVARVSAAKIEAVVRRK